LKDVPVVLVVEDEEALQEIVHDRHRRIGPDGSNRITDA
jgi:hypothetical protein